MKYVWICLASLCALACLCGGGLYLWGWSFYQSTERLDADAATFSEGAFRNIASEWRADTLRVQLDLVDSNLDPVKAVSKWNQLGPLESLSPFVPVQSVWRDQKEGRRQVVTSVSHAVFGHAAEQVTVKAVKLDAGWRILELDIHPESTSKP